MVVAVVVLAVALVAVVVAGMVLVARARADARRARERAEGAEDALAVAERRSRQALQDLPFVALRVDRDGRLVES